VQSPVCENSPFLSGMITIVAHVCRLHSNNQFQRSVSDPAGHVLLENSSFFFATGQIVGADERNGSFQLSNQRPSKDTLCREFMMHNGTHRKQEQVIAVRTLAEEKIWHRIVIAD
jgi:hypothetical protein